MVASAAAEDTEDLTSRRRNALLCCTLGGGGGIDGSAGPAGALLITPASLPESALDSLVIDACTRLAGCRPPCWPHDPADAPPRCDVALVLQCPPLLRGTAALGAALQDPSIVTNSCLGLVWRPQLAARAWILARLC